MFASSLGGDIILVSADVTRNGSRLRISDPKTGHSVTLDALQLAGLARTDVEDLWWLVDPGRYWRDEEPEE